MRNGLQPISDFNMLMSLTIRQLKWIDVPFWPEKKKRAAAAPSVCSVAPLFRPPRLPSCLWPDEHFAGAVSDERVLLWKIPRR